MRTLLALTVFLCSLSCQNQKASAAKSDLPTYSTLAAVEVYTGKGIAGEVLIPSVSRELNSKERERLLREIMKSEGWHIISAYASKEAFNEKSCAVYEQRSPGFKAGYLGKVDEEGKFSE